MATYGRNVIAQTGHPIMVSFDGAPEWKAGGVTIDWSTVPPVAADTTLVDGNIIKAGYSGLQFGAILTKISASGKYGPYTPAMTSTTTSAATVAGATQLPLTAVTHILPGDSLLVDTSSPQETVVVDYLVGSTAVLVAPMANAHNSGVAVAKPNDGRQTLTPGEICVLNMSVLQASPYVFAPGATDHPAVIIGGLVWLARLAVGASNQPTLAQLLVALPRISPVEA